MDDLRARLERLPKAELHLHLRGALPLEVFARLVDKYGCGGILERANERLAVLWREKCPNLAPFLAGRADQAAVDGLFCFRDFGNFLLTFAYTGFFFREIEDFRELVASVLAALARQRIVYAEITVSLREYLNQGLAMEDVLEVLETATQPGLQVRWIIDLVRDFGVEAAEELLVRVIAADSPAVVGLTLGGGEHHHPPAPFAGVYRRAAEAGLRRTVHAGEGLGPESVRDAVELLGVERIGHGIRAVEDPSLVELLAERQLPLEVSPTSNLFTRVVPTLAEHPVKPLLDAGVPVSINTDDPTFFGTTLVDEYLAVALLGVDEAGILELVRNGFRHAFAPKEERAAYLAQLEREIAGFPV